MKKSLNKHSSIKKGALSLGILLMMNLFFNTGISVFNPSPVYEDFCPNEMWSDQAVCEEYGGTWVMADESDDAQISDLQLKEWGNCQEEKSCWDSHEEAREPLEKINFFVLAGLGVLSLVIGAWISMPSAVANGLMFGGVLSILIGWMRSFSYLDDLAHFVISGIFFVILVLLGIKKLKD
jgi:hypothetical protein